MTRIPILAVALLASVPASAVAQTAAFFDDATDVILVDGQTTLGATATFEALLLFPSDTSAYGNVFSEWQAFAEDKAFRVGTNQVLGFTYGAGNAVGGGVNLMPDVWHHIAFVRDVDSSRVYIDGDLRFADAGAGDIRDGGGQPHIGAIFRDNALVNSFVGYIETLRISDTARYEGERFDPPFGDFESDTSTVLLFNFAEPAGSETVLDSGPQGLTGTLGGGFQDATTPVLAAEVPTRGCPAYPVFTDLWDVSRGTTVTATSGFNQSNPDHGDNMFGGSAASPEPGRSFFRDDVGDGYVHYVEWQTSSPVTIRGLALHAGSDANHTDRDFGSFRLFGFDTTADAFVELTSLDPPTAAELLICADIPALATDRFRAEFVQRGDGLWSGPRIMEIDGFGSRTGLPVSVELVATAEVELLPPYPNPAVDRVTVPFGIERASRVRLEVFDVLGRRVAVLADEVVPSGNARADNPDRGPPARAVLRAPDRRLERAGPKDSCRVNGGDPALSRSPATGLSERA